MELGLQTTFETTSNAINRAHDYQTYLDGVAKLRKHGIQVCTHLINGLPGETLEMMREKCAENNLGLRYSRDQTPSLAFDAKYPHAPGLS